MINVMLVTIHGFWSSPATWERLNAIWSHDEQLRGLRIYPFGYPSPKKPQLPFATTRVPGYEDVAQTLATEYRVRLADAPDIAFVTHSQGGLILQRFLTWMLDQSQGRELARIRTIVMLACPNDGSQYLRSVRHVLGFSHHAQAGSLEVFNRQVNDTQRTVLQRIVNATGVDDHQCRIPFHVYAGNSDKIVPAASGQGPFPGASELAGNHFSILDPNAPGNCTAATVKYHLLTDLPASSAQQALARRDTSLSAAVALPKPSQDSDATPFLSQRNSMLDREPFPENESLGTGDLAKVIEFPGGRQGKQELHSPLTEVLDASRRTMTILISNPIDTSELRLQLRELDQLLTKFSSTLSQSFAEAGASGNRVYTLREQTGVLLAMLRKLAESETEETEGESSGTKLEPLEKQLLTTLRELLEEWDKTAAPPTSSS